MATVAFGIEYTSPRSRLSNGLRIFYAIPHLIIVGVLGYASGAASLIQWFIILFTGKRNKSLWTFSRNVLDWQNRATTYLGMMYDAYPNFAFEKLNEPVHFSIDYEESADRLTNALRLIWAIPAMLISYFLAIAAAVITVICWFAILFTGTQPRGMFDFLLKVYRYSTRFNAYIGLLTDTYPKFE